jgi:steroid 5-alpha reductase family enzyme
MVALVLLWVVSVPLRNASIVDSFWSIGTVNKSVRVQEEFGSWLIDG